MHVLCRARHADACRSSRLLWQLTALAHTFHLQCCYSPDEKLVLTGTSAEGKDSSGALVVLSADTLERLGEIAVDGSAVAVQVRVQVWLLKSSAMLAPNPDVDVLQPQTMSKLTMHLHMAFQTPFLL